MDAMRNKVVNTINFSPDSSIPPLTDKVIIVTGGNQGIGRATVLELCKHSPRRIYLGARTRAKYDEALSKIKEASVDTKCLEFLELDLSSSKNVVHAAKQVMDENDRLDLLINSAGIMGAPPELTDDGYEIHFGVNHMGHALLTRLLLPLLEKTAAKGADVRIVNVSSLAAVSLAPGKSLPFESFKGPADALHAYRWYGISKLANVLHAKELARRYPTITSVSVHPGRVGTGLLDGFLTKNPYNPWALFQKAYDWSVGSLTVEQGAWTSLWAATGKKEELSNGAFYTPIAKEVVDKRCEDESQAKELWEWQEKEFASMEVV
jgi:NAD(P)-dependent dehydrogenase (short-subunit alcohol dehydrogenase family)